MIPTRIEAVKRSVIVLTASLSVLMCLMWVWQAIGPRHLFGAFLLNLLPTSWAPCVKSAMALHLPAGYYRLRAFERDGRVYQRLGVRRFQQLMRTPLFAICNRDIPRSFRNRDFAALESEMAFAETSHVLALLLVLLLTVFALVRGWWDAAVYLTFWNLLVNGCPAMLQRYNRGRLLRLAARAARGETPEGRKRLADQCA